METPFVLSESAARQIGTIKDRENGKNKRLRIRVVGGGCSGMSYKLEFDEEILDTDMQFESAGVEVIIDKKSILYLKGTILDFSDGLNGQGFVFNNPNAKTSCGCGSSFST